MYKLMAWFIRVLYLRSSLLQKITVHMVGFLLRCKTYFSADNFLSELQKACPFFTIPRHTFNEAGYYTVDDCMLKFIANINLIKYHYKMWVDVDRQGDEIYDRVDYVGWDRVVTYRGYRWDILEGMKRIELENIRKDYVRLNRVIRV